MDLAARSLLAEAVLADAGLPARVASALVSNPHDATTWQRGPGRALLARVRQHQEFLAGALQAGSPTLFADYVRWWAAQERARGGDALVVRPQLDRLGDQLACDETQRELVQRTLAAGFEVLAEPAPELEAPTDDHAPLRLAYLAAALGGDRDRAWQAVEHARQVLPLPDVYQRLLLWAQRQLGTLWMSAQISVAQEHIASTVTQSMLARLQGTFDVPRDKGLAMIAMARAELHSLPAQFAADLLELDGWEVAFVGTDIPEARLASAIEAEKPDALGLSVTLTSHLPQTVRLALALRARFSTLPIVLGGSAAIQAADLVAELPVVPPRADPREAFRELMR